MNVHKHARMTVHGRLLLVQRVRHAGWQRGGRSGGRRDLRTHRLHLAGTVSGGRRARPPRSQLGARPIAPPAAGRDRRHDRAPAPPALERPAHRPRPGPARLDRRHRAAPPRARPPGALEPKPPVSATSAARPASCSTSTARSSAGSTASATASPATAAIGPRARLGIPARRDRRRLAPGLHRGPARRARRELRRLPRPRRRLVRQSRRRASSAS